MQTTVTVDPPVYFDYEYPPSYKQTIKEDKVVIEPWYLSMYVLVGVYGDFIQSIILLLVSIISCIPNVQYGNISIVVYLFFSTIGALGFTRDLSANMRAYMMLFTIRTFLDFGALVGYTLNSSTETFQLPLIPAITSLFYTGIRLFQANTFSLDSNWINGNIVNLYPMYWITVHT
jgi:hypothetical protein